MQTHIIGTDLYHGPRHPRANTDYPGSLMVADIETWRKLEAEPDYTFPDATGSLGWCLVGDDLDHLMFVSDCSSPAFATELTPIGEQFVIPGCERQPVAGNRQLNLFGG
jgi:hypothetical protein